MMHTVHLRLPKRLLVPMRLLLDVLHEQLSGVSERMSDRAKTVEVVDKV